MASFIVLQPPRLNHSTPELLRHSVTVAAAHSSRNPSHSLRLISKFHLPSTPNHPPLQSSHLDNNDSNDNDDNDDNNDNNNNDSPPNYHDHLDDDGDHFPQDRSLLALLTHFFRQYHYFLRATPLITKAVTAGVLGLLSDAIAQAVTTAPTNFASLARFALYGLLFAGPQSHFWFQSLENYVRVQGACGIVLKLMLDQMLFMPASTAAFFLIIKVAEGEDIDKAIRFARGNLRRTVLRAWRVWPFVNFVNFALVPPHIRVLFVSTVSVFWVAYLSIVSSRESHSKDKVATRFRELSSHWKLFLEQAAVATGLYA